jgi:hypothetical protein
MHHASLCSSSRTGSKERRSLTVISSRNSNPSSGPPSISSSFCIEGCEKSTMRSGSTSTFCLRSPNLQQRNEFSGLANPSAFVFFQYQQILVFSH